MLWKVEMLESHSSVFHPSVSPFKSSSSSSSSYLFFFKPNRDKTVDEVHGFQQNHFGLCKTYWRKPCIIEYMNIFLLVIIFRNILIDEFIHKIMFAGKSTLLSTITETKSECASYEFTTLTCIPGVIKVRKRFHYFFQFNALIVVHIKFDNLFMCAISKYK